MEHHVHIYTYLPRWQARLPVTIDQVPFFLAARGSDHNRGTWWNWIPDFLGSGFRTNMFNPKLCKRVFGDTSDLDSSLRDDSFTHGKIRILFLEWALLPAWIQPVTGMSVPFWLPSFHWGEGDCPAIDGEGLNFHLMGYFALQPVEVSPVFVSPWPPIPFIELLCEVPITAFNGFLPPHMSCSRILAVLFDNPTFPFSLFFRRELPSLDRKFPFLKMACILKL